MKNMAWSATISMVVALALHGATDEARTQSGAGRLELREGTRITGVMENEPFAGQVRIVDQGLRNRVIRGIAAAREKLKQADLEVLDQFTQYLPAQGRYPTLRESLERSAGGDPLAHFALLVFLDGESAGKCGYDYASTAPGSTKVYICDAFKSINDPSEEGDALVHEWLHALGLCESPACDRGYPAAQRPTSGEIRVALRSE